MEVGSNGVRPRHQPPNRCSGRCKTNGQVTRKRAHPVTNGHSNGHSAPRANGTKKHPVTLNNNSELKLDHADPVTLGQSDLDPVTLGQSDLDPVTLGQSDFDPVTLGQSDLDPVTLGQSDLDLTTLSTSVPADRAPCTCRVFVTRSLHLEKIKFFGFDMDYTLAGK